VQFNLDLGEDGTIYSAAAVSGVTLSPSGDYEGIAYTGPARNSVFVSDETTNGVYEHNLTTGVRIQTVPIPAVFGTARADKSFESLTRAVSGSAMWTANEEGLGMDSQVSTPIAGTTVRLQKLIDNGSGVTAGPQYAYVTDPIHSLSSPKRSGVSDLVMLPDDTLITLERSVASATPVYRNSIYQVDLTGATDVSTAEFNAGLLGKTYTPATKTQLWAGTAGGGLSHLGEDMEGLALGPVLEDGNYLLVGIVDDDDILSNNTVVAFELSLTGCSLAGDYNCNGKIDEADQAMWRNTFGSTLNLSADGNQDGMVDALDYTFWRDQLGKSAGAGGAALAGAAIPAPEPGAAILLASAGLIVASLKLRAERQASGPGRWQ
jgi:Esterase-like activity of phytase